MSKCFVNQSQIQLKDIFTNTDGPQLKMVQLQIIFDFNTDGAKSHRHPGNPLHSDLSQASDMQCNAHWGAEQRVSAASQPTEREGKQPAHWPPFGT